MLTSPAGRGRGGCEFPVGAARLVRALGVRLVLEQPPRALVMHLHVARPARLALSTAQPQHIK